MYPNLILVACLFAAISLIWILVWVAELLMRVVCKSMTDRPRLTNITIRFLYEVYFEICLSVMIFASFMDFKETGSDHFIASIVCLALMAVAFVALTAITVLFWRHGPNV